MLKVECTIKVYINDGTVFEYSLSNPDKAREHLHAIISKGYRSCNNETGCLTHIPPHRIEKVVAEGGQTTNYPDRIKGT